MGDEARWSMAMVGISGKAASMQRYSMKLAMPSFTVMWLQFRQVTRLPNHWCATYMKPPPIGTANEFRVSLRQLLKPLGQAANINHVI